MRLQAFTASLAISAPVWASLEGYEGESLEILERDVCVIGGGASGTYSAIRLQQMNQTVALIEKESRLGGHVNTYVDAGTNQTYDYGVSLWVRRLRAVLCSLLHCSPAYQAQRNETAVTDFFDSLGIPVTSVQTGNGPVSLYANFANATRVSPTVLASGNITTSLQTYLVQLAKYPYLTNGFNLPDPVPEDLLLPFGEFVKKYDLDAVAFTIYSYNQGIGNILAQPTIYVLKYFPASTVLAAFTGGFISTARHNNQEVYDRALAQLESNAFLNTKVIWISRHNDGVKTLVSTPSGLKMIRSSRLLITIPPKLEKLDFLDMDAVEHSLFGQFNHSYYWNGLIKDAGIPDNTTITNIDPAAPYNIPSLPGAYAFGYTGLPRIHNVYYSSPDALPDAFVKADILATDARLAKSFGFGSDRMPEFVAFNAHNPFELTVPPNAIRSGFYSRLEALQGRRSTWWTGATWQAQDSSAIWNFTEHVILPQLVA